ncbi:MAG: hypothetical protein WA364_05675 [Candidatus Nitrosopolaris sp.]
MSYFVGMKQFFQQFCNDIITLDPSIRFVAVADEHGLLLSTSERKDLKPLLNTEETQQYAITAATRQYTRIRWQTQLGKIDYTCSHYDKLLRATIPLTDKNNHLSYVIFFTFDVDTTNFHDIIMKKIIPLINKNSNEFVR